MTVLLSVALFWWSRGPGGSKRQFLLWIGSLLRNACTHMFTSMQLMTLRQDYIVLISTNSESLTSKMPLKGLATSRHLPPYLSKLWSLHLHIWLEGNCCCINITWRDRKKYALEDTVDWKSKINIFPLTWSASHLSECFGVSYRVLERHWDTEMSSLNLNGSTYQSVSWHGMSLFINHDPVNPQTSIWAHR